MNKKLLSLLLAGCMIATTGFGAGCFAAQTTHHRHNAQQHQEMKRPPHNQHPYDIKKGPAKKEFKNHKNNQEKFKNKKQEHKKNIKNFKKEHKQAIKNHNKSQKKMHNNNMKKHNQTRHHVKNSKK